MAISGKHSRWNLSGIALLQSLRRQQTDRRPFKKSIVLRFRLPGENGIQLAQKIKAQFPSVRIAFLTSYDLPEYRQAALQNGADQYFVKDSFSWDEVEEFIKCHSA